METNWNQLTERYLQNELSEEGRSAFEQELSINPELREELEMHRLIQSAAKRSFQRAMVRQTGKLYLRNLRIKQFTIGFLVTAMTTVGVVYWIQNKKGPNRWKSETVLLNREENIVSRDNPINKQETQAAGKSSLIQPVDCESANGFDRAKTHFSFAKQKDTINSRGNEKTFSAESQQTVREDSAEIRPAEIILGHGSDELKKETIKIQPINDALPERTAWMLKYDSIGKFNELYCGYALVMDQAKFGFVDPEGRVFIPLIYDQIVVTTNIKSSKQKNKRQKKKVLYIPKRSGKDVKDCEEHTMKVSYEIYPSEEDGK